MPTATHAGQLAIAFLQLAIAFAQGGSAGGAGQESE